MKYYIDANNAIFAYAKSDVAQVDRINELERLMKEREPIFIQACDDAEQMKSELDSIRERFDLIYANSSSSEEELGSKNNEKIQSITLIIEEKSAKYNEAKTKLNQIEYEYQQLKNEYAEILPVFFDIRENLKSLKKMTAKEVDAHLNLPIPKEQLIAEAEQQKQSLLAEANKAIAPLQYAVDIKMETDEEKAQLTAWKQYCVLLNRIDTSLAPDIDWPQKL